MGARHDARGLTVTARMLSRRQLLALVAALPTLDAGRPPDAQEPLVDRVTLKRRPGVPSRATAPGRYPLGLGAERDGFLYVPTTYEPARAAPLLVLLHGAAQRAAFWSTPGVTQALDAAGVVALCPDARALTWDAVRGGFGPDVAFLDRALAVAFARCRVDPARIALGGFSDGASYALSLGVANGDLFAALVAFSPGFFVAPGRRGTPRIFVAHGREDRVLPIDAASRRIVPQLRETGYTVEYDEFDGGHAVSPELFATALRWFVPGS